MRLMPKREHTYLALSPEAKLKFEIKTLKEQIQEMKVEIEKLKQIVNSLKAKKTK